MQKHPRHRLARPYYLGSRSYFLTICASQRRKLFTDQRLVELLVNELAQFRSQGFSIYAYCFMPDHCHVLAVAMTDTSDLAKAVRAFKGASAAHVRALGIRNLWQRDYYDHILRSGESFDAAAAYIFENPVRSGLASDPPLAARLLRPHSSFRREFRCRGGLHFRKSSSLRIGLGRPRLAVQRILRG